MDDVVVATGATGTVGRHVVTELAERGPGSPDVVVRALSRHPPLSPDRPRRGG